MILDRRRLCAALVALSAAGAARAGEAQGEKKKGGGVSYIQFPTLTATVFRPDGRRGVLTVEAGVDIPDARLRTRAGLLLPRLRAAYVQLLGTYAAGLPPGSPPDPDYLSRALQGQTNQVLGQSGARLLLGTIIVN